MKSNFGQKGVSLLEILLYISLSSIILLTTTMFLMSVLGARAKNQTIATVDQGGSQAMSIITQTLRNATAINSPTQGNTASTLSVNTGTNDPTVFTLSNKVITMQQGSGSPIALTSNLVTISNLTFTNLSGSSTPGNISISFTVTHIH